MNNLVIKGTSQFICVLKKIYEMNSASF